MHSTCKQTCFACARLVDSRFIHSCVRSFIRRVLPLGVRKRQSETTPQRGSLPRSSEGSGRTRSPLSSIFPDFVKSDPTRHGYLPGLHAHRVQDGGPLGGS